MDIAGKLEEADAQLQDAVGRLAALDSTEDEDVILIHGGAAALRIFCWGIAYAGSRIAEEMANFTRVYGNRPL